MPICKKCGKEFPNHIVIDGISHNLQHRKYCLECSPLGDHNTRQLERPRHEPLHVCEMCGKEYNYYPGRHQSTHYCPSCSTAYRRKKRKEFAIKYKGGKCQCCGYDKCTDALEFHHRDPSQKSFGIANAQTCSMEKLIAELDKCDLLCANCHRELHHEMLNQ